MDLVISSVTGQQGSEKAKEAGGAEGTIGSQLFLAAPEAREGPGEGFQPQRGVVSFWGYGSKAPQTGLFKENCAVL